MTWPHSESLHRLLDICYGLYEHLGKPTHTLVPCWMPKSLLSRKKCTSCFALALYEAPNTYLVYLLWFGRSCIYYMSWYIGLLVCVDFVCRTKTMHWFLYFKRKFPNHFVFTLGCYLFMLFWSNLLALSVGRRLCINFYVSRANFLSTLRSHSDVKCFCYFWYNWFIVDRNYLYRVNYSFSLRWYYLLIFLIFANFFLLYIICTNIAKILGSCWLIILKISSDKWVASALNLHLRRRCTKSK